MTTSERDTNFIRAVVLANEAENVALQATIHANNAKREAQSLATGDFGLQFGENRTVLVDGVKYVIYNGQGGVAVAKAPR